MRVREYLSTSKSTSMSTITLELTSTSKVLAIKYENKKFSTRVLRVQLPSTSTPALSKTIVESDIFMWFVSSDVPIPETTR